MKAFYKFMILALATTAVFASCEKSTPYEPGKPAGQYDVCFSAANGDQVVLDLTAKSFDVVLERKNTSGALTIPVSFWVDVEGAASTVSEVSFADGQATATLTVNLGEIDPFVNYQAELKIPEEFTQPYSETAGFPRYGFVFYKEDYSAVATATYYDDFWSGEEWEVSIEYSPLLENYRVNGAFPSGNTFAFTWDKGSKVAYVNKTAIATGYNHASYGAISATPTSCSYDSETGEFAFIFKWTVSAGSFGEYGQYVYDINWK